MQSDHFTTLFNESKLPSREKSKSLKIAYKDVHVLALVYFSILISLKKQTKKLSPISPSLQIYSTVLSVRTLFLIWSTGTSWESLSHTLVKSQYNHSVPNLPAYRNSQEFHKKQRAWWVRAYSCWWSLSFYGLTFYLRIHFRILLRGTIQAHWYKGFRFCVCEQSRQYLQTNVWAPLLFSMSL